MTASQRPGLHGPSERKSASMPMLAAVRQALAPQWELEGAGVVAGYARNPIVYRCVRLIAEAAASVPFEARRAGRWIDGDPVASLMTSPNAEQSGAALLEEFYGHLQVSGDGFLELVEAPSGARAIHSLASDTVSVETGPNGWALAWRHGRGETRRRLARDPISGRSPILHMRLFNPRDPNRGLSPLMAARRAVDIHDASAAWNKALLDNAARPSGALIYGREGQDRLTDEQFARLKAELADVHQGAEAAGRPLLLEGGLEWRPFSMSPADMDFVAAKNAAAREIALAFGVPPLLLGLPGDNTYANYKEANLAFWRQTVLPLTRKTAAALSGWLAPWFGPDVSVVTRDDAVPALEGERASLWAALQDADFMTRAEKRARAGLPNEETEA